MSQDLIYCIDTECKEPNKIINSAEQQCDIHNGHKTKRIFTLRSELLEVDNESNPLRFPPTNEKKDLLKFIDDQIDELTKLFHLTMLNYGEKLKQFVNENLASLNNIQTLFKAVLDDNRDLIKEYQSELGSLNRDSKYFEEQGYSSKDINQYLQKTLELTKNKISEMSQITLLNRSLNKDFKWSDIYKSGTMIIDGKLVKNDQAGHQTALIEPRLNFQETRTVSLKINKIFQVMIQICNLKVVRVKCPTLQNIYEDGCGAYSHFFSGQIFATDTYAKGTQGFKIAQGDIIELQWNGPQKTFTTVKKSTGQRFEFKVSFDADAEIYFGVALCSDGSVEII